MRRSRAEWRVLCAESRASELTVREFAARVGVNPRTLSWWRSELSREARAGGFVEVVRAPAEEAGVVRVLVGERLTVELSALPDPTWLVELARQC